MGSKSHDFDAIFYPVAFLCRCFELYNKFSWSLKTIANPLSRSTDQHGRMPCVCSSKTQGGRLNKQLNRHSLVSAVAAYSVVSLYGAVTAHRVREDHQHKTSKTTVYVLPNPNFDTTVSTSQLSQGAGAGVFWNSVNEMTRKRRSMSGDLIVIINSESLTNLVAMMWQNLVDVSQRHSAAVPVHTLFHCKQTTKTLATCIQTVHIHRLKRPSP